jgi:hypothetical protein
MKKYHLMLAQKEINMLSWFTPLREQTNKEKKQLSLLIAQSSR